MRSIFCPKKSFGVYYDALHVKTASYIFYGWIFSILEANLSSRKYPTHSNKSFFLYKNLIVKKPYLKPQGLAIFFLQEEWQKTCNLLLINRTTTNCSPHRMHWQQYFYEQVGRRLQSIKITGISRLYVINVILANREAHDD